MVQGRPHPTLPCVHAAVMALQPQQAVIPLPLPLQLSRVITPCVSTAAVSDSLCGNLAYMQAFMPLRKDILLLLQGSPSNYLHSKLHSLPNSCDSGRVNYHYYVVVRQYPSSLHSSAMHYQQ